MVNTAGFARWCGQTIEDRCRLRSGNLGVSLQAISTKGKDQFETRKPPQAKAMAVHF